jgi:hypothetical protein
MSHLPRPPSPPPPASWRRRLPHFTPAHELHKGEYLDGEKVFIDYGNQFGGGGGGGGGGNGRNGGGGGGRGGGGTAGDIEGRWFTEDGRKKYVDNQGEVTTGKSAYKASEKQKKSAGAARGGGRGRG